MRIAIASGKGGTGKTTIAVNLAALLGERACLFDCDVEEPNTFLFLAQPSYQEKTVSSLVPEIDSSRCTGCGDCSAFCAFNALAMLGRLPTLFPELCHGCGGCARICPQRAIREKEQRIGIVKKSDALCYGQLDIGVSLAPLLVRAVRETPTSRPISLLDAPPGTACAVVAAIRGVDFLLLVTEPTPFGLHDLKLAIRLAQELSVPFGVVENRAVPGEDCISAYCQKRKIPLLQTIPDDRRIAEVYARGQLIVDELPEYRPLFEALLEKALKGKELT